MCIVDYFNTISTTRCLDLREASQNGKWSRNEAKKGNSSWMQVLSAGDNQHCIHLGALISHVTVSFMIYLGICPASNPDVYTASGSSSTYQSSIMGI